MIEKLQAHYGFERMPFGRNLAPGMLHRHDSHNQAVARISWCIAERSMIHTTSRGYPRAVNNLALQSLVAAFATGKNLVDEAAARASVSEVVGD
ncbi:hypothetical protein [Streptomyces mirabilis]|uniref:hypothetical protein n=1 Tax=Streptomyces mirabilis TaxID=68239 RepID=UPI00143EEB0F|nr:hypothetical protein [Streptomyces sp. RLB1-33]QIY76577.1 hypothetical protein HEP84_54950 [Streptomyces sp. RLB1-33]